MKKIELLKKTGNFIINLMGVVAVCTAPVFVFILVWVLVLGNVALVERYLDIDMSSKSWFFIIFFGSLALAGHFAMRISTDVKIYFKGE